MCAAAPVGVSPSLRGGRPILVARMSMPLYMTMGMLLVLVMRVPTMPMARRRLAAPQMQPLAGGGRRRTMTRGVDVDAVAARTRRRCTMGGMVRLHIVRVVRRRSVLLLVLLVLGVLV